MAQRTVTMEQMAEHAECLREEQSHRPLVQPTTYSNHSHNHHDNRHDHHSQHFATNQALFIPPERSNQHTASQTAIQSIACLPSPSLPATHIA